MLAGASARLPLLAVAIAIAAGAAAGNANAAANGLAVSHRDVCDAAPAGYARCAAEVATNASGTAITATAPRGYGPADLQSAYGLATLASSAGADQTVAIVDSFDHPNAESDLAVYRSRYGLPACTTANGCFRKVDQRGGTSYPSTDSSWAQEISLDLDMVSATCPRCHILLVEADSDYLSDLNTAVNEAATLGATQISNSWGAGEYSGQLSDEASFHHPGIAITAASGDSGYGVWFPASSRYVTAVGGTSLTRDSSARGWSETAWSGAGAGCSAYVPKPSWQTDSPCAKKAVADVSAVADPRTGVAVYDSLPNGGVSGWMVFGGTSAAAPLVASFDALIGPAASSPQYPYQHAADYFDVTSGSDGSCTWTYLCVAGPGYDGPTGLGSPNGSPGTAPSSGGGSTSPSGGGSSPSPPAPAGGGDVAPPSSTTGGGSVATPEPPVTVAQPVGAAEAPLRLSVSVAIRRIASALARGLRTTVACSRACDVSATLALSPGQARRLHLRGAAATLARASGVAGGGSRFALQLRFSTTARRLLARRRTLKLTLEVVARPAGGAAKTTRRALVLVR